MHAQVDLLSAQVTTLTGQTMELQDELQQLQQDAALAEQLQADLAAVQEEAQQVGVQGQCYSLRQLARETRTNECVSVRSMLVAVCKTCSVQQAEGAAVVCPALQLRAQLEEAASGAASLQQLQQQLEDKASALQQLQQHSAALEQRLQQVTQQAQAAAAASQQRLEQQQAEALAAAQEQEQRLAQAQAMAQQLRQQVAAAEAQVASLESAAAQKRRRASLPANADITLHEVRLAGTACSLAVQLFHLVRGYCCARHRALLVGFLLDSLSVVMAITPALCALPCHRLPSIHRPTHTYARFSPYTTLTPLLLLPLSCLCRLPSQAAGGGRSP